MTDFNDPTQRADLATRVGPAEYNRQFQAALRASIVRTVNGYDIRPVQTMFGRLYQVMGTKQAFSTLDKAETFARSIASIEIR
jgi:hypothetical protein